MGLTTNIGRRIELVAMDPHFNEISIALYCQDHDRGPQLLVHTYSRIEGEADRIDFVVGAMAALGGMEHLEGTNRLRFACGSAHYLASKSPCRAQR